MEGQNLPICLKFNLNVKIYPLDSIYRACYYYIDKVYIFLDGNPSENIEVVLTAKENATVDDLERIKGEFMNEILHCTLRTNIAKNNQQIREYIISQALFSTLNAEDVLAESSDDMLMDYASDPLGIAIPWEERYATKENLLEGKKEEILCNK